MCLPRIPNLEIVSLKIGRTIIIITTTTTITITTVLLLSLLLLSLSLSVSLLLLLVVLLSIGRITVVAARALRGQRSCAGAPGTATLALGALRTVLRPFFTLRTVGPRIFESTFRNHCAKKLVGALRKSTSFV